jgi:hypothetical protein
MGKTCQAGNFPGKFLARDQASGVENVAMRPAPDPHEHCVKTGFGKGQGKAAPEKSIAVIEILDCTSTGSQR